MMCYTRILIIFIAMMVVTEAYKSKRDISFFNADITSYRKPHPRNFFYNQPFINQIIEQQTSPIRVVRDQNINQQFLHDLPLKDHTIYPSEFPILRHQPFKKNSFTVTSFKDKPLFRDAILKNQELREEREVFRDNPFIGQSLTSGEIFERQVPTYKTLFEEQLFTNEKPFKNLHYEQLPSDDHAFELSSMPGSPFKHLSPLNIETSPSPSTFIPGSDISISSIPSSIDKIYSSDAAKIKFRSAPMPGSTTSLPGSCNAPTDSSSTITPSISVSTNPSSIVGHILTGLTTKSSSPGLDTTSIAPFAGNTLEPIQFYAAKHGAVVTSSFPIQNELKSNIHAHLFINVPKNSFTADKHDLKFVVPLKDDIKTSTHNPMLNYFLSEEQKSGLKDVQNSFTNYALPKGFRYGWSLQQFSPEISFALVFLNGKTNFVLSNISAIPISIISGPMETSSDFATMLPLKSTVILNMGTNNNLLLSTNLPLNFMGSIPNSLSPSISNSISGSITGGISTGIPSGMMADIPASIPTLNLGQSLHHIEQLQTQEARNPWYPTDLQLQLGGFGGINYTLHTGNPATRPMELMITKAGLTLPKL